MYTCTFMCTFVCVCTSNLLHVYVHVYIVHECVIVYKCYFLLNKINAECSMQLPVIAVDCYCPVISPFTGNEQGHLAVLLAMGSAQQVHVHLRIHVQSICIIIVYGMPKISYVTTCHITVWLLWWSVLSSPDHHSSATVCGRFLRIAQAI